MPIPQPIPTVTPADVDRIVLRDFPPETFDSVRAILDEYTAGEGRSDSPRVELAILKLADGNLEALREHLDGAKRDFRDVLAAAEYPSYGRQTSSIQSLPAEEQRRIVERDWKQYQEWLIRKAPLL